MKVCSRCNSSNNDDARFCTNCGNALSSASASGGSATVTATDNASPREGTLGGATYRISGYEMQAAVVQLGRGQSVLAEPGALLYMRGDVTMNTSTGGGLMAGMKRALAGDSLFLSEFASGASGEAAFAAPYPGTIHPLSIGQCDWLCQRHSFLCCSPGVSVTVGFSRRLGYGLFAGEGFILQKLTGSGDALVHAGGHFIRMQLAPGEQIRVDTGTVVAFDGRVSYDIEFVRGFRNMLFGGEGIFFIVLTGPGDVILQTLSFDRLVSRIAAVAGQHQARDVETGVALGGLGGILGGMLGGNQGGGNY